MSAGVVEGRRAFPSFHGSLHHHPRARATLPTPAPTSYPNLSVADILDRYQDAHKDFLVSILNAKAKEDERKTEEERYKTEQIRLQSKQLELELALEKRRGSPPTGRSYASGSTTEPSNNAHYSASTTTHRPSYSAYQTATPSSAVVTPPSTSGSAEVSHHQQQYGRHYDHNGHAAVDADPLSQQSQQASSSKHSSVRHHPYQQDLSAHPMQPSPQSRPPSLKINTAVRQSYPNKRVPGSPQHGGPASAPATTFSHLPYGSGPSKGSGRHHYTLPALSSSSAHSSPVANIDYQSQIPPPLTPKDDHVSPTSASSPAAGGGQGQNLKRKSIHHEAVMDAVRAKVLRNAEQQQRGREQQQQNPHQQQPRKKTSMEIVARRKPQQYQHRGSSPERPKRTMESSGNGSTVTSTMADPKPKQQQQHNYTTTSPSKLSPYSEGPVLAPSVLLGGSPTSPSTPVSATAGSGQSRSCSPPSAGGSNMSVVIPALFNKRDGEYLGTNKSPRRDNGSQYGYTRAAYREDAEDEQMASPTVKYDMDRPRADRSSEIGGKYKNQKDIIDRDVDEKDLARSVLHALSH
ncbi:hypothetical protein EDD11_008379 [Mortierella claussenii]|nr:hypothetical protein EDD11_008379 [Mortierella claussenii]